MLARVVCCLLAQAVSSDVVNAPCPNQCSGHGLCGPNSELHVFECTCADGYKGFDCSLLACPHDYAWVDTASADDTAHALAECSNAGLCDTSTGTCACEPGFEGAACENLGCPTDQQGVQCHGRGLCLSMSEMAEYRDDVAAFQTLAYTNVWDADRIHGCACELGWSGYDCSVRQCVFGDDPLTTGQADEEQVVTCTCDTTCTGGLMLSFRNEETMLLPFDSVAAEVEAALEALSTIRDVTVTLAGNLCGDGTNPLTVTFTGVPGDVPPLRVAYSDLASTAATPTVDVTESVTGTREFLECNNRGKCNRDAGICACDEGHGSSDGDGNAGTLGDCGFLDTGVAAAACPIVTLEVAVANDAGYGYEDIPCGIHGTCDSGTNLCTCFDGWEGHDCTQRQCGQAPAWFDEAFAVDHAHQEAECANRGICDRSSGFCTCQAGFTGAACSRATCPTDDNGDTCSGAGTCESMRVLALNRQDEYGIISPVTYGTIVHGSTTWDADKVQGCLCTDDNVFGYDCSLTACPTGGPPEHAVSALTEIQTFTCTSADLANLTSVEVTFRDRATATLDGESTAAQVEVALESIAGDVTVTIDADDTLCAAGNNVVVEFHEQFGNVALLAVSSSSSIITTSVTRTRASTQKDFECAARGMCDYDAGTCECFDGYTSGDGLARMGSLGDCGFAASLCG